VVSASAAAPVGATVSGPAVITGLARLGAVVIGAGQAGTGPPAPPGQAQVAPAAGWLEVDGSWEGSGALDTSPSLLAEAVDGACAGAGAAVAVGSAVNGNGGSRAAAWTTTSGTAWTPATISPVAAVGAAESMTGCLSTGNGYLAYGTSPGPAGTTDPALWQSSDGSSWTRQDVVAFTGSNAGAVTDLALQGTTWLATTSLGAVPTASSASSSARLWASSDAGATWSTLDTSAAPWTGALDVSATLAGFVGSGPVVVGTVDGRLTIWQAAGA
jgi:hypothetical protein